MPDIGLDPDYRSGQPEPLPGPVPLGLRATVTFTVDAYGDWRQARRDVKANAERLLTGALEDGGLTQTLSPHIEMELVAFDVAVEEL